MQNIFCIFAKIFSYESVSQNLQILKPIRFSSKTRFWGLVWLCFFVLISHVIPPSTMTETTKQPEYKYKKEIEENAKKDCPPSTAVSTSRDGFRWVRNPIEVDDFKSHFLLGLAPKGTEKKHIPCTYFGISLYSKIEFAIKAWQG